MHDDKNKGFEHGFSKTPDDIDEMIREIYLSAIYDSELEKKEGEKGDIEWVPQRGSFWQGESLVDDETLEQFFGKKEKRELKHELKRDRKPEKTKKKAGAGKVLLRAGCALMLICGLYAVAVFSDIPFVKKWRDIYIETAMGTMTHQWLATAFIPDFIIDDVMGTRTDIEAEQEVIDTIETDWEIEPIKGVEEKTAWKKLEDEFFEIYTEVDRKSFEKYIEKYGEDILDDEGYLIIDEAGLDQDGTGIKTVNGDEIMAIDTRNGITIVEVTGSDYNGRLAIIKNPEQVELELASGFGEVGATIGAIAKQSGAVLAVNASGFYDPEGHGNGGIPHGLVIKDGDLYSSWAGGNNKTIGFDYNNSLQIGQYRDETGLRDAVEFKPALIIGGKKMVEGSAGWGISPRTAIGQTENGQVLLLVVDGRQPGHSIGCTMGDLADIMLEYGAYQACNLDGGSSSIMYYNGRKITKPSAGDKENGRRLPNAFVVMPR